MGLTILLCVVSLLVGVTVGNWLKDEEVLNMKRQRDDLEERLECLKTDLRIEKDRRGAMLTRKSQEHAASIKRWQESYDALSDRRTEAVKQADALKKDCEDRGAKIEMLLEAYAQLREVARSNFDAMATFTRDVADVYSGRQSLRPLPETPKLDLAPTATKVKVLESGIIRSDA